MARRLVQTLRQLRPPVVGKRRQPLAWIALAFFGPILLGSVWLLWSGSSQIIAPGSLPVGDYQRQALAEPALAIERHITPDGQIPYLAISPSDGNPGKRGKSIRDQLTGKGIHLSPYGHIHSTIVLLHGRRGRKESLLRVAERFTAIGFRCLIPDLPAHGESPLAHVAYGTSEEEKSIPSSVVTHARQSLDWPVADEPIALWGMSMGGAFATAAAATHPDQWKALMIVSSFDDLDGILTDKLSTLAGPLATPLHHALTTLVHHRSGFVILDAKPAQWAATISSKLPVFVAHGDQDSLIDHSRGQRLFQASSSENKQWLTVTGADHHNVLITEQLVFAAMGSWLLLHIPPPSVLR